MRQTREQLARQLFYRTFQGPDLWASPALWEAYRQWQGRHEMERQEQFKAYLKDNKKLVEDLVNALPNPFVNAKKGEYYELVIQLPPAVGRAAFKGLEAVGLSAIHLGQGQYRITGFPPNSGDFKVGLFYAWRGCPSKNYPCLRIFKITVNPDPRELWQDIPSDQNGEYARPDRDFEIRECHGINLIAASQRGRSHAHAGLPRDDAFGLGCSRGWQILAVADGAGSAPYSRKGAELACAKAMDISSWLLANSTELDIFLDKADACGTQADWMPQAKKIAWNILPKAALEAYKAIREEATVMEREIKQYATTLLLAAVRHCPSGWAVLSFQVGDGAMAALDENSATLLAQPDEGDFAGQTKFLTMPEIFEQQELSQRMGFKIIPELSALLLLTDGITDPFFGPQDALNNPALWHKLWREVRAKARADDPEACLQEWLGFWSKGNHDDRTLAILMADA